MGVSKTQVAENRKAIVDTAARVFRARGVGGIGVVDLMKEAGFTHGGFYNHFESKEALAAEAFNVAFAASLERLNDALESHPENTESILHDVLQDYLSVSARDNPGAACPSSTLVVDAARHGEQLQTAYAAAIENFVSVLTRALPRMDGEDAAAARERSLDLLSGMIGAIVLARGLARADRALSDEVLAIGRKRLPV